MVSLNNSRQPHKDATRDTVLRQDKRGSKPGFDITELCFEIPDNFYQVGDLAIFNLQWGILGLLIFSLFNCKF